MFLHRIGIVAFLALMPLSIFALGEGSRIEMGVSPIRHDFSVTPRVATTKEASFFNQSDTPYQIYLSAEDCTTDDASGTPKCRAKTATSPDPDSLSTWITFDGPTSFVVPPHTEKKITFTVTPPPNATPGGHYGAIFFNNPSAQTKEGNTIQMLKRPGVLLLVTVPGKIVYNTVFGDISIDVPLASAPSAPSTEWEKWMQLLDPRIQPPQLEATGDFVTTFQIPVTNEGNTHILPTGYVELYDEDGTMLTRIGKESIRNEEGVFLGEKIVDYLPINDEGGNVLPGVKRVYTVLWRGFAYEEFDVETRKNSIKFLSPSQYYSSLHKTDTSYLLPWEKLRIITETRHIRAKIFLEYLRNDGVREPYEREQMLEVTYSYIGKGINFGALLLIGTLVFIIFCIWLLLRKKEDQVEELEEEIVVLEDEVEDLEDELDEFEKARILAREALEKKKIKKAATKLRSPASLPTETQRTRRTKRNPEKE